MCTIMGPFALYASVLIGLINADAPSHNTVEYYFSVISDLWAFIWALSCITCPVYFFSLRKRGIRKNALVWLFTPLFHALVFALLVTGSALSTAAR